MARMLPLRRLKPTMNEREEKMVEAEQTTELDPIQRQAFEWIARFVSGEMGATELEAMKAWYRQGPAHVAAYAEARRLWHSLGPVAGASLAQGAVEAPRSVARADVASSRLSRRAVMGGAIAASAAAYCVVRPPLGLWPSYAELTADYRTEAGGRQLVKLTDAVSLELNTRTSVAIRSQTAAGQQIELLSGEAAISNGAASPVTVVAADGRITALEADFNLRLDGREVSISCLKGSLTVERGGSTTSLSTRQQVSYGGEGIAPVSEFNPSAITAWRRGMLLFDFTPVEQVIAEVNRYRAGRIILLNNEIGRRLLSARLRTNETDKLIVQLVRLFGARARELPGGIVVLT